MIGYNFNVDIAMLAFVPGNFMATVALWDKQCCPHLQQILYKQHVYM